MISTRNTRNLLLSASLLLIGCAETTVPDRSRLHPASPTAYADQQMEIKPIVLNEATAGKSPDSEKPSDAANQSMNHSQHGDR